MTRAPVGSTESGSGEAGNGTCDPWFTRHSTYPLHNGNNSFSISLCNLLIILYQLTKFEATGFDSFRDIFITSFQRPNLQRAITRKKKKNPGNLLIILYQLTKFESPRCSPLENQNDLDLDFKVFFFVDSCC